MLLKKNDDNPGIEKQILKSQKELGSSWVPQGLPGRGAGGKRRTNELGSNSVPLYSSCFASTYTIKIKKKVF